MSFIERCSWVESIKWAHIFFAIKGGVKLFAYQFIECGGPSFNNNILSILSSVGGQNKNSVLKLEVTPFNSKKMKD